MQRLALPSGANLTPDDCYAIDVVPQLCGEGGILYGGWAMAVMVEVAQAWSGPRVRTLATSFVAPVRVGDELRITVTALRSGRQLAHCRIDGQVSGIPVLSGAAVRIPGAASTAWTLLDVELASADGTFCVGVVREWSQDGALVATADQTVRTGFAATAL